MRAAAGGWDRAADCLGTTMGLPAPEGRAAGGHTMPEWAQLDDQGSSPVPGVGADKPHPARMYDYYLGGKDNFEADRVAAEKVMRVVTDAQRLARANREFLVRTVRAMTARGI